MKGGRRGIVDGTRIMEKGLLPIRRCRMHRFRVIPVPAGSCGVRGLITSTISITCPAAIARVM